jgi:GH24 family phage-related lysozyme (muramidase)
MNIIKFLLIISILVGFRTTTSECFSDDFSTVLTERMTAIIEYEDAYETLVDTLKWHEGFRAYPYLCLAEVATVGYGHAIREIDTFDYPLSEEQADSLLRVDLDWAIEYVRSTTDLEHLQLLAIAHFVYALGCGNFDRSTLKALIMDDLPIDGEIVKWVHIRTKNGIIRSNHLVGSRRMELELYNNSET